MNYYDNEKRSNIDKMNISTLMRLSVRPFNPYKNPNIPGIVKPWYAVEG
jgi:hypothetical protein